MRTYCKDGTCPLEEEICCQSCEVAGTCTEVCDGFNEEGIYAPCPWKEERND